MPFNQTARRLAARLMVVVLAVACLFAVQSARQLAPPAQAATSSPAPQLLMIHGYTDTCAQAFYSTGTYSSTWPACSPGTSTTTTPSPARRWRSWPTAWAA
jgi:hypothetical protein